MTGPRYTPLVASLPATVPFVGPETQERLQGAPFRARLGANESVFGPSPNAISAMAQAAQDTWMYGDPENHDLRNALAKHENVAPGNIIVGEGIDGLLGYLVRMLTEPGDAIITSDGAYPTFNFHVAGYGGALHKVPYRDDHEDPAALLDKAGEVDAKLIYFANPDNPMGSWQPPAVVEDMAANVPPGCLLVLDEAYAQFLAAGDVPRIAADNPQVIRMRTFSKAYGMAGARVGYGIGAPDLIMAFNKVRNHFGMTRISQAGALAALGDINYLAEVIGRVSESRTRIAKIASDNGLAALPSAANFVTIDCGRDGTFAQAVLQQLIARGVFVRMPFVAPQNRCIRVSAGTAADLEILAQTLPDALDAARATG
ncbi:MAG: pyridoxal phosphate-dependent aminotransferase [Rhodobacter sp.]|nr:pyridoxal phosphate-dependent aminotransferase [Rhodobacter sp.]